MTTWLNTYSASIVLFMLAYLAGIQLIGNLPALFIVLAVLITFGGMLYKTGMALDAAIARIFLFVLAMLAFFLVKHFAVGGFDHALAAKIALFHLVFMAGLMIGYYKRPGLARMAPFYTIVLLAVPLAFFLLFAKGRPPSEATFFFNRNTFAAFFIFISPLLLGFGSGRQLLSLRMYVLLVAIGLILISTMGAILAFVTAALLYFGLQAPFNKRIMRSAAVIGLAAIVGFTYVVLDPNAFQDVQAINRARFMVGLFSNIQAGYWGSWQQFDMATAVSFAPSGELDMSATFRFLHWADIFERIVLEGSSRLWTGGGTGWIEANQHLFLYNLTAHSEYVRTIAEQGLLHAIIIFGGIILIIFELRRNPLFIPLFAGLIFFSTESLFNDFVVTSVFFFVLGSSLALERRRRLVRKDYKHPPFTSYAGAT